MFSEKQLGIIRAVGELMYGIRLESNVAFEFPKRISISNGIVNGRYINEYVALSTKIIDNDMYIEIWCQQPNEYGDFDGTVRKILGYIPIDRDYIQYNIETYCDKIEKLCKF